LLLGIRIFKDQQTEMEETVRPRELELPLQLQFAMRKAELEAQEMTWDQLYAALLNLYQRRLIEWAAVRDILAGENIELEFDLPTQLELVELAMMCEGEEDDEDDEDDQKEYSVF
jgi:hypothetical protein